MSTDLKENQLLKPGLLGKWIAEHADIWQMHFLSDEELGRLAGDRGLSFSSLGDDVKGQIGVISLALFLGFCFF